MENYPSPPSIPEMDDTTNFRVLSRSVRDFPVVDWTLLVSNILDPDHGLFARECIVVCTCAACASVLLVLVLCTTE